MFEIPINRSPPATRNVAAARRLHVHKQVRSLTDISGGSPVATRSDSVRCHTSSVLLNELHEIKELVRNLSSDCMALNNQLTAIQNPQTIPIVTKKVMSFADAVEEQSGCRC